MTDPSRRVLLRAGAALSALPLAPALLGGCSAPASLPDARTDTGPGAAPDPVAAQPLAVTPARRAPLRIPGAPVQLTHGPGTDGRLALTFNAEPGADPAVAARTLDLLRGRGLRVTVLAVGTWLAAEPALARRLLDEGHELGNHTEHHKDLSLLTEPAVRAEIEQCAHRLFRLGGGIGPWLRSPRHRESDPRVIRAAQRAGYPHLLAYDTDPADWRDPSPATIRARVLRTVGPGGIVTLHLGRPHTLQALPALLTALSRGNLRPVPASELFLPRGT
ncbi:polysaccharide deacetylase family protein [Streptomyces sp. NPDC088925]|uniref:polysaccharide deacetylase family protein n=1 Tax=Streptomyces sp. NPDC088925 TaxID=3365914 RepID=UPI003811AE34